MQKSYSTYLMMVATALFWGSNFVVGKYLVGSVRPFTIAFLRFSIAAILLSIYTLKKEGWPQGLRLKSIWWLVILGLVGTFLANGLVFPALKYSTAINGSLIMALIPATTALLAFFVYKERLSLRSVACLVLSFIGVIIVLAQGQEVGSLSLNLGDGIFLLAMFCGAMNYVLVKLASKYFTTLVITAGSLLFGSLLMLPFALNEINTGQTLHLSLNAWSLILYMAIITTTLGFYFWNEGIYRLGPAKASMFFNLIPIFSVIMSAFFLREQVTMMHLVGLLLIVGGIIGNQSRTLVSVKA